MDDVKVKWGKEVGRGERKAKKSVVCVSLVEVRTW